jgi:hypothetical protein
LFVFCFANETFFVCLYLNKYWSKPLQHSLNIPDAWLDALVQVSPELFKWTSWLIKNVTWPQLVGAVTFPICAGKQMINVVQFWKASKIVSHHNHVAELCSAGFCHMQRGPVMRGDAEYRNGPDFTACRYRPCGAPSGSRS